MADRKEAPVDVVLVGFGWTGAIMAKELTDAGLQKVRQIAPVHVEQVRTHLVDQLDHSEFLALGAAMARVAGGLAHEPDGSGGELGEDVGDG